MVNTSDKRENEIVGWDGDDKKPKRQSNKTKHGEIT